MRNQYIFIYFTNSFGNYLTSINSCKIYRATKVYKIKLKFLSQEAHHLAEEGNHGTVCLSLVFGMQIAFQLSGLEFDFLLLKTNKLDWLHFIDAGRR